MTYDMLKNITTGLLVGDNVLPSDEAVLQGMINYALTTVAMQADSLHLMTLSTTANVLRLAQGDYLVRMPEVPRTITDAVDALDNTGLTAEEIATNLAIAKAADIASTTNQLIDIDEELMFAVARYLASYFSKEKGGIHVNAASRIILDYNAKTYEITEQMQAEALAAGVADLGTTVSSTEFTL